MVEGHPPDRSVDLPDEWIDLAVVGRAHGVRGFVRVHPFNPDTTLLEVGRMLVWRPPAGASLSLRIAELRQTADRWLLRFEGYDQRDAAEALVNGRLALRRAELPVLGDSEFYLEQLRGLRAEDTQGRVLGRVVGFMSTTIDLLMVADDRQEILIPVLDGVVLDIDEVQGRVLLSLPDGLLDE